MLEYSEDLARALCSFFRYLHRMVSTESHNSRVALWKCASMYYCPCHLSGSLPIMGYSVALLHAAGNAKLSCSSRIYMNGRDIFFLLLERSRNLEIRVPWYNKGVEERGLLPRSL